MKYLDLKLHIDNVLSGADNFAPVYSIWGDDECLISRTVKRFENIIDKDYQDFNLIRLQGEQDFSEALDALDTFPMFDNYKLVVLPLQNPLGKAKKTKADNLDGESAQKVALDRYLESPSPTSILLIVCDSKEVAQSVKGKGIVSIDCSHLSEEELTNEILAITNEEPFIQIEPIAIKELILRTQNSMGRIESEVLKLKAYCESKIRKQDVCDMVASDIDYKLYELANAVSQKNCDVALSVLNVFFENGLRGVTIINLLYGKYRELLHAGLNKDMPNDELAKLLGVSSSGAVFYIKKTAANYTQMKLKRCVDYLHALQYDVLLGKRNENSAVHEAVLSLITM